MFRSICITIAVLLMGSLDNAGMCIDGHAQSTVLREPVDYTKSIVVVHDTRLDVLNVDTFSPSKQINLSVTQQAIQTRSSSQKAHATIGVTHIATQTAYLLFETWNAADITPQYAQITRIGLESGVVTPVYERDGINSFVLSPDSQHSLVTYYQGEIQRGVPPNVCLLIMKTGICKELDIKAQPEVLNWVDNESFTVVNVQANVQAQLYDIHALVGQTLEIPTELYIYSIKTIPGTQRLLVFATLRQGDPSLRLLIYDLESYALTPLPYRPIKEKYVTEGAFSPDGRYLAYGSGQHTIVDFETGQAMATLDSVAHMIWLANNEVIAQIKAESQPTQLIHLNIASGETKTLATGDEVGLLLKRI